MNEKTEHSGEQAQQHAPIHKADGLTAAERYLARLCEKNFLSLWSYPGVYRDQGRPVNEGHGKEVCDLLVVFGQHIIIFSDKNCQFPDSGNLGQDWRRWFKKAIKQSAEQAWGAQRWITQFPDRIFLDRECKCSLPIALPPIESAIFHLVIVAHGVSARIRKTFSGSGSLMLDTGIKGFENHKFPFYVGDLAPEKAFVHVFDDDSLRTLMSTRDTISDFVAYLNKREKLLRGKLYIRATGEEQLLPFYLRNYTEKNEHDFAFPIKPGQKVDVICLPEGHWDDFQNAPERIAQINEDRISYAWDSLIEKFSYYAMRGEQHFVTDGGIRDSEKVLRFMAREPRWKRRYLAKNILEMLRITPADKRRLRVIMPTDSTDPHYVFLLVPTFTDQTNAENRTARMNFLGDCCAVTRLVHPDARDIIGIATESGTERGTRSEDAIYFDGRIWTSEMETKTREVQVKRRILTNAKWVQENMQEFPDVDEFRKNPRNKPCPCGSGRKYKHCCLNS